MKRFFCIFAVLCCLVSCSRQIQISLEGVSDFEGMFYIEQDGRNAVDSVPVHGMPCVIRSPYLCTEDMVHVKLVSNSGQMYASTWLIPYSKSITLDFSDPDMIYEEGSPLQLLEECLEKAFSKPTEDECLQVLDSMLAQHPDDWMTGLALHYQMFLGKSPEMLLQKLASQSEPYRSSSHTQMLTNALNTMINTAVGKQYVDFEVEYNGNVQKLSDYVGGDNKVTIVDFWASWCSPCRHEIPYLKHVYETYKDQGVMVVGVATWDKPQDTESAIQSLEIPYPQIINAGSIGSSAYGVAGIPQILMIDADGTIVARDLSEDNIEKAVLERL